MQKELVDQRLVSTECILIDDNKEYGTGILIPSLSDEYDFVFTALHCLKGKVDSEDNKFNLYSEYFGKIECISQLVYNIKGLDIAIVRVKKLLGHNWMDIRECKEGELCHFSGFPQSEDGNRIQTEGIRACFANGNKIRVEPGEINLGRIRAVAALGGFSGSPIFSEKCNTIYFSGILISLVDPNFLFNKLNYISIREFLNIIKEYKLVQIRRENPNLMEVCISKTFVSEDAEELYDLLLNYAKKLNCIKIQYFIDWLKEKVFLPYGKYPTANENVWIGILKFLTFMYIRAENEFFDYTGNTFDETKFINYIKQCRDEGIKYFHSYDCNTFPDLLPVLYRDYNVYKDLNCGDTVIANFGKNKPDKAFIPRSEIANVVKNIAQLDDALMKDNMDITSPSVNKSLDILHIYQFEHKILDNWNYETGVRDLDSLIKRSIEEVIEDVKGV